MRVRGAILLALFCLFAAPPAEVLAAPGVGFLDARPLELTLDNERTTDVAIVLINGGPAPATLSLVALDGPEDRLPLRSVLPALQAPGSVETSKDPVAPGQTWTAVVHVEAPSTPGTYSGVLAAISSDGSSANVSASVVVKGPPTSPAPDQFAEPLPDPLTLHAVRILPLGLGGPYLLAEPTVKLDPALAGVLTAGPLIDGNGKTTEATVDTKKSSVTIEGAPEAGTFVGVLSRPSATADAPDKVSTISLSVKDNVVVPLLVLIAGIAAAFALENWFSKRAPRLSLEVRLEDVIETSQTQTGDDAAKLAALPAWIGEDRKALSLYQPPASGLLATARKKALSDFDATPSADERETRWGVHGSEFTKVRGYIDVQAAAQASAVAANESYQALRARLPDDLQAPFDSSALVADAKAALGGGRLVADAPDLTARSEDRERVADALSKAAGLADVLETMRTLVVGYKAEGATLDGFWARLASMPEDAPAIARNALALHRRLVAAPPPLRESLIRAEGHPEALAASILNLLQPWTGGAARAATVNPSSESIRAKLRSRNRTYTLGAGALVAVTGLSAQYLGNPVFGSWADYAAIFVWAFSASAFAQLLKYAATIALPGLSHARPADG